VVGEDPASRGYARVVQTAPDRFEMQTGSRVFRRAGGPDIDLVGVIHVAERSYFQNIQARLDRSSLVLYEGVTAKKSDPDLSSHDPKGAYARLGRGLGLEVQDAVIDYTRPHFRRCDLSLEEMLGLLDAEILAGGPGAVAAAQAKEEFMGMKRMLTGGSILTNFAFRLVGWSPALRERVRFSLVGVGAGGASGEKQMSPRLERLILEDRNAHVIAEIRHLQGKGQRRVAVFYGAAHLRGIESALRSMGYRPAGETTWSTAIAAQPYAAGITPAEVDQVLGKRR
jgi:hypothetical protein